MYKQKKYGGNSKFWVSEQLGFENLPVLAQPFKNTGDKPVASVYQTWSTEGYIPYIYYSIMSQMLYTDIKEKADIYIFVDEERYHFMKWIFRDLVDESCFISVSRMMAVKYMVTCHPILHKYKAVAVCDSDMFFYSNERYNFYEEVEQHYEKSDDVILIDSQVSAVETFWSRQESLNKNVKAEEYIDFFDREIKLNPASLEKWLEESSWYISPIFIYNPKTFVNPRYYQYAITCAYKEFYCDETVWLMWALARLVPITAIQSKMKKVSVCLDFGGMQLDKFIKATSFGDKLNLVHPLAGPNRVNPTCLELLRKIEKEFREVYGN